MRPCHLKGLFKQDCGPSSQFSDWVDLGWSLRTCISNKLQLVLMLWPRDPTLRTTAAARNTQLDTRSRLFRVVPQQTWVPAPALPILSLTPRPSSMLPRGLSSHTRSCLQGVQTVTATFSHHLSQGSLT